MAPSLRSTASYRYDLTDVTRQVLADDARRLLPLIRAAYETKALRQFDALTHEWMRDMAMEDRLLGTNEYFLLGRWLSYVPAWTSSPKDLEQIEYDAHSILTTWGDRTASASFHEYSNRDWAGLVSGYYAPRWKLYFGSLDNRFETVFRLSLSTGTLSVTRRIVIRSNILPNPAETPMRPAWKSREHLV